MEWIFGYGSLLAAGSNELPPGVVPCRLLGWRREWGVAMDNARDLPAYKHFITPEGSRPDVMVAFLDIVPAPGAVTNGLLVPVAAAELPGLDRRERNYVRIDVSGQLDAGRDGRVWAYAGREEARARAARGRREGRLVVADSYRDRVLAGFERLGQRAEFEHSTAPSPPVLALELVTHAPPASPRVLG